ncbi:MAG: metal dependent phosphohydrolase [Bacteroidetes bacterium]|nr:metal dependent phosphohydrolase [Bacteroidota bacterium]
MKKDQPDYIGAELYILETLDKKLPKDLFYHGLHHTRDVYGAAMLIAKSEDISHEDLNLLKIATMFHDAGFITHYKNHEDAGCKLAQKVLPRFGFDKKRIKIIEGMILATKIPQAPKTQLERIICDADLDYLGRDDFRDIAKTLFDELKVYMNMKDEKVWNSIQLNFLKNHRYHTAYSQKRREAKKQKHLKEIIKLVESYNKDQQDTQIDKSAKKETVAKKSAKKAVAPKKVAIVKKKSNK